MKPRGSEKNVEFLECLDLTIRYSQVVLAVKNPPAGAGDIMRHGCDPFWEHLLEEGTATHSSILAWKLLWTEKPGELQAIV